MYGDPKFTFPYVPSHLHHMIFELVKNSLRAVQDKYDNADDDEEAPPIRCVHTWGGVGKCGRGVRGTGRYLAVQQTKGCTMLRCEDKVWKV